MFNKKIKKLKIISQSDILAIVILLLITLTPFISVSAYTSNETSPAHAPNIYVDYDELGGLYDMVTADWYCPESGNALNTYWATHMFNTQYGGTGYCGFQNKDGNHVVLLSLWDLKDGRKPTIEYVSDNEYINGNFGGEGTGKQVFSRYNWKVNKWYTMKVQLTYEIGKTIFELWIKEENSSYIKVAAISYPVANLTINEDSFFMEDFNLNYVDSLRSCRLRNTGGHNHNTGEFKYWSTALVSTTYFPHNAEHGEGAIWNAGFDANYNVYNTYLYVDAGGRGFKETNNNFGKNINMPITTSQENLQSISQVGASTSQQKFTGWRNGKYYENDVMVKNTTKKINGKEYTFDKNGNKAKGWINDSYYADGQKKYKRDSKGIVTTLDGKTKVSAWIENERYSNGILIIRKCVDKNNKNYGKYCEVELNNKGRAKAYKDPITRWVGNQFFKDGILYAELYNKKTKKVTADGLAYKIGYKNKNGKIDETKLVKNEFLGTKTSTTISGKGFNTKGEMVFATSQGKAYITKNGIITNKLFSGKVASLEIKNGMLLVTSSTKKDGWIGKSYYINGEEVAKIINLRTYSVGDRRIKTLLEDFVKVTKNDNVTAWVGSKNYSYDSQKKETVLRYINKSGIVYKVNSKGEADISKPVTGWIFQEYYKDGRLVAGTFKEDKQTLYGKGKAYTIKNGKADKIYNGFLGIRYFDKNGILVAVARNGKLMTVKNGEESKTEEYKKGITNYGKYGESASLWVGDKNYGKDGKIRYVKKYGKVYVAKDGKADTSKPVTIWIGTEYYQKGILTVAYKPDGKAYKVTNGKTTNNLVQGFAGARFFEKGVLKAEKKSNIMYEVKNGIITETKFSGKLGNIIYKDGKQAKEETSPKIEDSKTQEILLVDEEDILEEIENDKDTSKKEVLLIDNDDDELQEIF